MDKQSEQGSELEKKNPTDKRHRPSKQKNVPSTARGKLERKRKTWSKSGAGTNYPRHSAPIPKWWLSEEELSKGSSPATTKFPSSVRLRRAARARQVRMKQSGSMAGTSSTADMVKSRGRFRRPGASSQRAEPRKLQQCQGASSCGPCTPAAEAPPCEPKTSNRWGAIMAKSIAVGRPRKAGRKTSAGLRRALLTSSGRWGNSKPTFSRSGRRHRRSHQE